MATVCGYAADGVLGVPPDPFGTMRSLGAEIFLIKHHSCFTIGDSVVTTNLDFSS